jgi:hypothetical protein
VRSLVVVVAIARTAVAQPSTVSPEPAPSPFEAAVRAGWLTMGTSNEDSQQGGTGPWIEAEGGVRHFALVVGYATYRDRNASMGGFATDLRAQIFSLGVRAHGHLGRAVLGGGLFVEYWAESGTQTGDFGSGHITTVPYHSNGVLPLPMPELHAGYSLPNVGRFAPQIFAMATFLSIGVWGAGSARIAIGARF